MMPQNHAFASALISMVFLYFTKSPSAALLCFLAGVLIDADHLLDFWMYKGKIVISREVFGHFYEGFGKIYVVLHSFEIIAALLLLGFALQEVGTYMFGVAVGMLTHIILDFFSYELHPAGYFITYRILKGFDKKYICLNDVERGR